MWQMWECRNDNFVVLLNFSFAFLQKLLSLKLWFPEEKIIFPPLYKGMMLALISGQAERIFNQIKRITRSTSNNAHSKQIIPNLLVCLQAQKNMDLHDYVARTISQEKQASRSCYTA